MSLQAGPGQLMWYQARALKRAGANVALACETGRGSYFLRTGIWARRRLPAEIGVEHVRDGRFLIDHSMKIPSAGIVFVHNLLTQSDRYLPRNDFVTMRMAQESALFSSLGAEVPIVANSKFVGDALVEHFGIDRGHVEVVYPGYRSDVFNAASTARHRERTRALLRIDDKAALIGFVTPGDWQKRGLSTFLDAATRIAAQASEARFLIVGHRQLPDWAKTHPLIASGKVHYRPATKRPQPWFAALDVFLYAAHFEEFGLVVLESMASGVPVLTSRRVGAAECLPPAYRNWLLDEPDAGRFAEMTLALLAQPDVRAELAQSGLASVAGLDHRTYGEAACAAVLRAVNGSPREGSQENNRASASMARS